VYLPRVFPIKTAPFLENSQTVASELPDMRHLPTIVEFPQPTIADTKTARPMIRNRGLYRTKIDCMTVGIVSWAGVIGATCRNNRSKLYVAPSNVRKMSVDF
jgi:hypothetical protein